MGARKSKPVATADDQASMTTRREPVAAVAAALGALALDLTSLLHDVTAAGLAMLPLLLLCLVLPVVSWTAAARARAQSHAAAARDSTTGLPNGEQLRRDIAAIGAGDRRTLAIFDLVGFKKYNDAYGFACGDELLRRLARRLAEATAADGPAYRLRGAQFAVLATTTQGGPPFCRDRGAAALFEIGEGFMIRCASGEVAVPGQTLDASAALKLADQEVQSERARLRLQGTDETTIGPGGIPGALAVRSPYEVDALAGAVGRELGLDEATLETLATAAALRDVGTMAIPDALVDAPTALTEDDWRFVQLHTLVGERLLSSNFGMEDAARIVRSSHERWDGTGYPDGLAGESIPLAARVVFVCSAFQDMTAPRAHRPALEADEALLELDRCAGTQFDPRIVRAFSAAFRSSEAARAEIRGAR
jgi:two-component system cell cycle response regulator